MSNKSKTLLSVVCVVVSITLLVICAILAEENIVNFTVATVLIVFSVFLVCLSVFYAAKVDYETGVYECRKCKNTFKPTFKAYIRGAHTLTTRYLKCPKCKQNSWSLRKKSE